MIGLLKQGHQSGANDPDIASALIKSFVLTLGRRHGSRAAPMPRGGGRAQHQLEQLLTWFEKNLGRSQTVEARAQRGQLSIDHFSRKFKRSVGHTPGENLWEEDRRVGHGK